MAMNAIVKQLIDDPIIIEMANKLRGKIDKQTVEGYGFVHATREEYNKQNGEIAAKDYEYADAVKHLLGL